MQLACFTEQASGEGKKGLLHFGSHIINMGFEHEEISYKGDVDSGRFDRQDIRSDLDAINMYHRMNKVKKTQIFNEVARYHQGIHKGEINRVDEFYKNNAYIGSNKNDQESGKNAVEIKLEMISLASAYIQGRITLRPSKYLHQVIKFEKRKQRFWKYLEEEREEENNK